DFQIMSRFLKRIHSTAQTFTIAGALLLFASGRAETVSREANLEMIGKLVRDDSPRVRLEALRALAKIPSAKSAELALSVLDKPMDPFLDYALWLTINDLADPWIAAIQSGEWKVPGHEQQLDFGLKAIEPEKASMFLGQLLGDRPLPPDCHGPWIELTGRAGWAKQFQHLD